MISLALQRIALADRIATAVRIVDGAHPPPGAATAPANISREVRGLTIVLLYAAYENLLYSLTRTLLEAAISLRVGNRRLRPGLRAFALAGTAKSARDMSERKLYTAALPKLVEVSNRGGRSCTIDPGSFPDDGSFMRRSQIELWCTIFEVPNPNLLLHRTWTEIDTIVSHRNGIAHGRLTPEDVGRGYSEGEIRKLIADWHMDWADFLGVVEALGQSRNFFRTP